MASSSGKTQGGVSRWAPVLVLVAYLALGYWYSVATPIFEASDEIWHYPFVKELADGHGLPIQRPRAEDNVARQEGSQPPLYYALGAAVTRWIDTGTLDDLVKINPHAKVGVPLAIDNKNMAVHDQSEDFPYSGVGLAVHLIRWLSVFLGAITVLCTYLTALEVLPDRRLLAAGSAAVVAFNPMFLFISASVNNDNLVNALSAAVVLLLVRQLRQPPRLRRSLLLGLLLGGAALSKLSGLALLPLAGAVFVWVGWVRKAYRPALVAGAVSLGMAAVVAGWWYLRNWELYGDPTGLSMMLQIVGMRNPRPSLLGLLPEFEGFRIAFWGLFGAVNILMDNWLYRVFDWITVVAGLGLVIHVIRERRRWPNLIALAVLAIWSTVVFASFLRWTQTTLASQGRLIFPAISAIGVLLVVGLASWVPRRAAGLLAAAVAVFLFAIAAVAPARYILPAYAKPGPLSEEQMARIPRNLEITFDGVVKLLGYELGQRGVPPGGTIRIVLYWQALAAMNEDYSIFVHAFLPDGTMIGQVDTYPGRGTLATSEWPAGMVLRETYEVPVAPNAPSQAAATVEVGLYRFASLERLEAHDEGAQTLGTSPIIARLAIRRGPIAPLAVDKPAEARFAGIIALAGHDLPQPAVQRGETLLLSLHWQALERPADDYTVFVQLLQGGRLVIQQDLQPRENTFPTSLWEAGEEVEDRHLVPIGANAPPGEYQLIAGLYRLETGERLIRSDISPPLDHVELGSVRVKAE